MAQFVLASSLQVMDYDVVGTNDFLGHAWIPVAAAVMQRGIIEVRLQERDDQTPWERPRRQSTLSSSSSSPSALSPDTGPPSRPPPPGGLVGAPHSPVNGSAEPNKRTSFLARLSPRASPVSSRRDSKPHECEPSPLKMASSTPDRAAMEEAVAASAAASVGASARNSTRRSLPSAPGASNNGDSGHDDADSAGNDRDNNNGTSNRDDSAEEDEEFEAEVVTESGRHGFDASNDAHIRVDEYDESSTERGGVGETARLSPSPRADTAAMAAALARAKAEAEASAARADDLHAQNKALSDRVAELEATVTDLKVG